MAQDSSYGAWSDADFAETANQHIGLGVDQDIPDEERFVASVVRALRARTLAVQTGKAASPTTLSIFLLEPRVPKNVSVQAQRSVMIDNGLEELCGRIWFVGPSLSSGHHIPLPDTDAAAFELVIDELGLGNTPAIVFDPRGVPDPVRWHPGGLAGEDWQAQSLVANVTHETLFHEIQQLYETTLMTPNAMVDRSQFWKDADNHYPSSKAEVSVQAALRIWLARAFPSCMIRHEQSQPEGRADLLIEELDAIDPARRVLHAALELKVLRSFTEGGHSKSESETKNWIEDGVKQAAAYKIGRAAAFGALCCFDMRTTDEGDATCFAHVEQLAEKFDVKLGRWFLFKTPAEFRKATIQA